MHTSEAEGTFQPQAALFGATQGGVEAGVLGAFVGAMIGGGHAVAAAVLGGREVFSGGGRDAVLRRAVADGTGHGGRNVVEMTSILLYWSKKNHAR